MREFAEAWPEGVRYAVEVRALVHDVRSDFQHIQVFDSVPFGRLLALDGRVQTTERDEALYHEALVHVPMMGHAGPRSVLIVGGGDGGALRRVLQYPVERVTMVEIDRAVVEVCRELLPSVSGGAFEDARARLIIGDGVRFLQETDERFDVILVDSTDPIGPAAGLFSEAFYRDARRALAPHGILATESGSPLLMPQALRQAVENLRRAFPIVKTYLCGIPAYVGTLWSFTAASATVDPAAADPQAIARRLQQMGAATAWYTASMHRAAFVLPNYLKAHLGAPDRGDPPALPPPMLAAG